MMLLIRRLFGAAGLVGLVICAVLLLNFTAPNPTGRRYSSAIPLTSGNGQQIGLSAEMILAQDLNLPRNDAPEQRQCFCGAAAQTPGDCRICVATSAAIDTYRRPDFIGSNFIAESKNRRDWLYAYEDQASQIQDYVTVARELGMPLWIYVRVNTTLSPEFVQLAESTGGGVVRYFAVPGWVDPVDQAAQAGAAVSVGVLGVIGIWEAAARRNPASSKRPARGKAGPVAQAARKAAEAEAFARRKRAKLRRELHTEQND
jgi:hypothetical protein